MVHRLCHPSDQTWQQDLAPTWHRSSEPGHSKAVPQFPHLWHGPGLCMVLWSHPHASPGAQGWSRLVPQPHAGVLDLLLGTHLHPQQDWRPQRMAADHHTRTFPALPNWVHPLWLQELRLCPSHNQGKLPANSCCDAMKLDHGKAKDRPWYPHPSPVLLLQSFATGAPVSPPCPLPAGEHRRTSCPCFR